MNVLQHPRQAFTAPELQKAVLATDVGLPYPVLGRSAAVFRATIGPGDYALRCYLRDEASSRGRYAALSRFVAGTPLLTTSVGTVIWHEGAIRATGDIWPVLQMEWIEGELFGDYVGYLADSDERQALGLLARRWLALVGSLQQAEFAHGDLQHQNIIIDRQHRLRLVDFDGVWCPPLRGQALPTERGHDNFQPPGRTPASRWGPRMDTFSALVIYLALTALSLDTGLWAPLNDGENLLFTSKDFSPPFNTKVWDLLRRLSNETVDRLARRLQEFCVPTGAGDKTLAEVVTPGWWEPQGKVPAPRPGQARPHPRPSGGTGTATWYSQPLPMAPTDGYQSPVAQPVSVPIKRGRPAGADGKWWETTRQTTSPEPASLASAHSGTTGSSARRPTARSSPTAASAARRTPAKKARHPYRLVALFPFIAGIILFTVLEGDHTAWSWSGWVLIALGIILFYRK
jgi:eukaryotic-like serine/threonine-protein kinase